VQLRAGPGSGRARPRHGPRPGHLQPLPRPAPADGVLRAAARPRAPAAHRLGDRTRSPALSASATRARATATADGRPGAAKQTTQMTSPAVGALTTLASLFDAALLTATANVAGSGGRPSSLATRTVTPYRLGGLSMPGTVSQHGALTFSAAHLARSLAPPDATEGECAALASGAAAGRATPYGQRPWPPR
jgi:hypothetical protein